MIKRIKNLKYSSWLQEKDLWDLLISFKLYVITFLLIYPVLYLTTILRSFSIFGIVILGFSIWLILKFVFFESRRGPAKFFKILLIATCVIIANFVFSLIISIIQMNMSSIFLNATICICSGIYFLIMLYIKPFKILNSSLTIKKLKWSNNGKYRNFRKNVFRHTLVIWLLISNTLILAPYPIYMQMNGDSIIYMRVNQKPETEFGIWTYGQSLDDNKIGEREYASNKTLKMLADEGIYFIYGLNQNNLDNKFISRIMRCKNHGIEVHLSIGSNNWGYTNIWSFNSFKDEIEEILITCQSYDLLGNPITTLVYDMETLFDTPYPFYGFNGDYISKLKEYNKIQKQFIKFNDYIKYEYNVDIKITTDIFQGIDSYDGDNDLMNLWGLIEDKNADMSYMVYRRDNFWSNEIIDHLRFLQDGDIIILNAWKHQGYLCWENIGCAIKDSRLVLGYPEKTFKLEIWELNHFLISYGEEGLEELVEAICEVDSSEWPPIRIFNRFPYSFFWDTVFLGIIMIDIYSPLFRFLYGAY